MENTIRIMTANIWGDFFNNPVEMRQKNVEEIIKKYSPDVLGLQEITKSWYSCNLLKNLSNEYTIVEGTNSNFAPLLYKSDEFDAIERGWEIYAETPDASKCITWAVLKRKRDGKDIAVCNTHLWWMERNAADEELRLKNAKQLIDRVCLLRKKYDVPAFAFGDFNSTTKGAAIEYLSENEFMPAYNFTNQYTDVSSYHGDPILGSDGRHHGVKTKNKIEESLDHILTFNYKVKVKSYVVVEDQEILDATDHSPVYADVEIN